MTRSASGPQVGWRRSLWLAGLLSLALLVVPSARAASGDLVWERALQGVQGCPEPVIANGALFTQTWDTTPATSFPRVRAFDASRGELRWQARGPTRWDPVALYGPGIAAAGDRVFAAQERQGDGRARSGVTSITAYDAETGEELWSARFEDRRYAYAINAIAADREAVFAVGERSPITDPEHWPGSDVMVLALDGATGAPLWSDFFDLGGRFEEGIDIAVSRGRVVTTASLRGGVFATAVRAQSAASGRLLWQDRVAIGDPQRLAVAHGRVYTLGWRVNRRHSFLLAHDLASGRKLWQQRVRGALGLGLDAARRTLAVLAFDARRGLAGGSIVEAYDGATGEPLWRRDQDEVLLQQVLVRRDTLFTIGSHEDGVGGGFLLTAERARSGAPLWSIREADPDVEIGGCRLVHTGKLLVTTSSGSPRARIRAFEP